MHFARCSFHAVDEQSLTGAGKQNADLGLIRVNARNISRVSHSVRSLTSRAVSCGRLSTTTSTISSSMALASA
ncbi:MAG: hypothetical protein ACLVJH_17405 [Faecalibacterium prausnitzii]